MIAESHDAAVVIALALRLAAAPRRKRRHLAIGIHGDGRQHFARLSVPLMAGALLAAGLLLRRARRGMPFSDVLRLIGRLRRACCPLLGRRSLRARVAAVISAAAASSAPA